MQASQASQALAPPVTVAQKTTASRRAILRSPVLRNTRVRLGLLGVFALVFVALFAGWIAPNDPTKMDYMHAYASPGQNGFILGSDEYGRDVLSRLLYGARVSLQSSVLAIVLSTVIGVGLGLLAGYFGGIVDAIIMRAMDVLLCFPPILLAIALLTFLGNSQTNLIIAMTALFVPGFVRVIHASVRMVRHEEYVVAARSLGATSTRIILTAVLPNILSPILIRASATLGAAILLESGLSFLGLGSVPPTPSWGIMLSSGRTFMTHQMWLLVWPSVAVAFAILVANLLGDGLRDALDPRLRR